MWFLGFVREFKILFNNKSLWLLSLLFYIIIILSVPLALNELKYLSVLAPVIVWLTFILAGMQLCANIFTLDYYNGWYQQIFLHASSPSLYFFYKMCAVTLFFILPVCCITPILVLAYALSWLQVGVLCLSLMLSAPALCFISGIFAAVTVSNPHSGLLNIMVLPLCIPLYILGVGSTQLVAQGMSPYPSLALLAAISIGALLIAPVLIALSIRNSFEY